MNISCATDMAVTTKRPCPVRITTRRIPSGSRGTDWTVEQIRTFILEGAKDFAVRRRVVEILMAQRVRARDYLGEIKALFEWVQRNFATPGTRIGSSYSTRHGGCSNCVPVTAMT